MVCFAAYTMGSHQEVPQHVGPYRIEQSIGRGGMGEVFRGFDERLDRAVALKRVRSGEVESERRERFRREAKAIARISHSAIVQIHDWVEDDTDAWIVMELVPGRSLRERLSAGIDLATAIDLARQVAEGLAVAHAAGVVHRDLKPENIVVTDDGDAKILDFGLAKRRQQQNQDPTLTATGKVLGTLTAMSPEQALGRPVEPRSDLFSLGTLLYEMVTGVSPFRADSPAQTLIHICTVKPAPVHELAPEVPMALSRLIDELLQKDAELRPADAAAVARRLAALGSEHSSLTSGVDALDATEPGVAVLGVPRATLPRVIGPTGDATQVGGRAIVEPTLEDTRGWMELEEARPAAQVRGRRVLPIVVGLAVLVTAGLLATGWLGDWTWDEKPRGANVLTPEPAAVVQATPKLDDLDDLDKLDEHQLYTLALELLDRFDKRDNLDRAVDALQRLLAKDPSSAPAHAALARTYGYLYRHRSKDPDWLTKAEAVAEQAVTLDPFLARARASRGFISRLLGRQDEAREDLQAALELDPGASVATLELARVHASQGELEAAERLLIEGVRRHPDAWPLRVELGVLCYRTGRYEEARTIFEAVVERVPDNVIAWRNLSAAHYSLGDLAKASTVLQRAIEIEPNATLYGNLGTFLFAQGLYAQAVEAFERVISLAGGAHDYRMWANLADAYRWTPGGEERATEAYARALQLLAEGMEAQPQDAVLRSRQALYLAKRGECERSQAALAKLMQLAGLDGAAHYRHAVAAEVCGQRAVAIQALSDALEAGYAVTDIRSDPELRTLREDPAYHRLMVRQATPSS